MVKFGRKFFFDGKHTKKRRIITLIIIIFFILLILLLILLSTKFFQKKNNKIKEKESIIIRNSLDVELFQPLPDKTAYFTKLENFNSNDIFVEYSEDIPFEQNFDECTSEEIETIKSIEAGEIETSEDTFACVVYVPSEIGTYDVNVKFKKKEFNVELNVVDTKVPELTTKDIEIVEEETYKINDFIVECTDNSRKECSYEYYYKNYNSKGNTNFGKYKEPGEYDIQIVAIDESGNISTPQDSKLTITPKPTIITYVVTFNSDGGTEVEPQTIIENELASTPTIPSKEGYNFNGWYLNNQKFDFKTPITSDITLVAKWTKKTQGNKNKNTPSTNKCSYGDLSYDSKKYPVLAWKATGSCALSQNEANSYTYGNKVNLMVNNELGKIQKWAASTAYTGLTYAIYGNGAQGVPNKSGKGYVGYFIRISIAQTINEKTTEVARYYLDPNGKRIFELNTINMPES